MSNKIYGFTPLYERVLIRPDGIEKETDSGIILPPESRKRPNSGEIVSLGHLASVSNAPFKVGDHVLYMRYAGFDVEIDGELLHLVMANDLVGIIDNSVNKSFEIKDYAR